MAYPRKKKEAVEAPPVKVKRGERSSMCVHRIPPTSYCSRCDS